MTIGVEQTSAPRPVNPSASRVRRYRERRREGLRLFTVTVPETVIEVAIARGLLPAEDRTEPWPVIQACYAALVSDAALDWLICGLSGDWGGFSRPFVIRAKSDCDRMSPLGHE